MRWKQDRREFLKTGLVTTAAALVGGPAAVLSSSTAQAGQFPDVVVCHGKSPSEMTRSAVNALGGMNRFVKPGNKVVIKPNMSFARGPETGANTRPEVVAELARLCIEAGASKVAVLDRMLHNPDDCLSLSRIPELCAKVPHTVVSHVGPRRLFREVNVNGGSQLKTMEVVSEVLDADVLIAAPVGKSHSASGVSLSMKGMMGLIHDRVSFHSRYNLHEAIADMVSVLKPNLVVIDGTRILSSGGPGGPGKVIPLDVVVASTDMVAADAEMVALGTWYDRKFNPEQVRHIQIAAARGLGRMDLANIRIEKVQA